MFRQSSTIVLSCFCLLSVVLCEESNHFFLTAAKSVPRIGRSANKGGHSDFEKFFLKASKSVPRIGRRIEGPFVFDQDTWDGSLQYPNWNDIAYFYEYQPELFASDDLHSNFEQRLMADSPSSIYDVENARYKRALPKKFNNMK